MRRRWIIRAVFMLPILLCVGGWVSSSYRFSCIRYSNGGHTVQIRSWGRCVELDIGRDSGLPNGFACRVISLSYGDIWIWPDQGPKMHSFLGFSFGSAGLAPVQLYELYVPYWFLIAISSAVLFLVWRNTRSRGSLRAFPVEVAG